MPNYFEDYETVVYFISKEEMVGNHQSVFHDGLVMVVKDNAVMEFSLRFGSNPLETAGILVSAVRAGLQMHNESRFDAFLPQQIPPSVFWAGDSISLVAKT